MPQPLAVHIGYHKTATTWLQHAVLPHHARIRMYVDGRVWHDPFLRCIVAESDRTFDPVRARAEYERGLTRLDPLGHDDLVVVSAERLSGHAASGGYDAVRIASRLHAAVPEARVFMVVRSQIDMIESEYRQLVGEGYPGPIASLWTTDAWKSTHFDLGQYEYDALVREYQRRFGADSVATFTYEGLVADRTRFLQRLAAFLELAPFALDDSDGTRTVHPGIPNRGVGILRALNHVRRSELNPYPLVNIGAWWRGPLAAMARRLPSRRHLIPRAKRAELATRYAESNRRLQALIDDGDFAPFAAALHRSVS